MIEIENGVIIVVPVLNEERYLAKCIDALLDQDYRLIQSIVIVDGGSSDSTRQIALDLCGKHRLVRLIDNPQRIQSVAVNLVAASALPGEILVRADAHADYPTDFVSQCVAALRDNVADSVVVSLRTVGMQPFQRAVAAAQNSLLGNGGSAHRRNTTSRMVDHGHHAAFCRSFFLELGGYNETFTHNEDAEFDIRAGAAGGRIWLCSEATINYYPRSEIKSLAKQYFNYGRGRARNMLAHRSRPKVRQLAPLLVSSSAFASVLAAPVIPAALLVPLGYVGLYSAWAVFASLRTRDPAVLGMGVAAAAMHVSWSAGFLKMAVDTFLSRQASA
ncbi:glycosyltransferase family 2 protein [Methylobacterium sp. BTF04]|uniref:glycosyltransferase n=1 Tax=Methylobacterium sp. BTF04 TaxID=2708300 RepID=UPI0013D61D94|nr:glycosyltransferase family 2 protein [Methylobacterium sp. BTF04]